MCESGVGNDGEASSASNGSDVTGSDTSSGCM